jgi:hypothetical protein
MKAPAICFWKLLVSEFQTKTFQIFFIHLVTIPVAPMITGMAKHFMFHIR